MNTDRSKPRLEEIAAACGVSKMTVSRVLRDDPRISDSTRQAVLRAAEEANYFPPGARNGAEGPAHNQYHVLFHKDYSLKDVFFSDVILSVQCELFQQGCGCSFGIISASYAEFLKLRQLLQPASTSGVIVVGDVPIDYMNALLVRFPNSVLVDNPGGAGLNQPYDAVVADNALGSSMAVRHLLRMGRRRILLIYGAPGHYFSRQLLKGYRDTLEDHQIALDPELMVASNFHIAGGYQAVERVLASNVVFDAILTNDEMACGALKALKASGRRVPEDVSVVGFDGLPMGEAIHPALTTVAIDREKMGILAVRRLLALENEDYGEERFLTTSLFPALVVRQSCGARQDQPRPADPVALPSTG
jgi:DNA-binding LacI/PurR family transcriptional regulator